MKIESFSNNYFRHSRLMELDKMIFNNEGNLYVYLEKNKWNKEKKVIKELFNDKGDSFGNKLLTINALIDNKNKIGIDELVMPEKLAVCNGNVIGFTMPYIENINFKSILKDSRIDSKVVISYFKQIGNILKKIKELNDYKIVNGFYLNDIHEANFILNKETNVINVVDLDSCKISNNKAFAAVYLSPFSKVTELPNKYLLSKYKDSLGYIEPSIDTDLYCYCIMILNYLYKGNVQRMEISEFYTYLCYLCKIGFPKELLDCFCALYEHKSNINPVDFLDLIPNKIEEASNQVYKLIN